MDALTVDGRTFQAVTLQTPKTKLLAISGGRGVLGCGYLNVATADKVGDALAVVTGVASYDDMLAAEVKLVSAAAAALGVVPGMTGRAALARMA